MSLSAVPFQCDGWRSLVGHYRVLVKGRFGAGQLISWARLLKHVFELELEHCPNCGAEELKIIAAILEQPMIEKILTLLGLDPRPPPNAPPREPERHQTG